MPAKKTLRALVADQGFRAGRHHRLLVDEELGLPPEGVAPDVWRELGYLQLDYRTAEGERERRRVLDGFLETMRRLAEVDRPRLTMPQSLALRIGLSPRLGAYADDASLDRALRRRWRTWVAEWGDDFESGMPCPPPPLLEADDELRVLAADRRPPKRRPRRARLVSDPAPPDGTAN